MSENRVSANVAFRKGRRQVVVWPIVILILVVGGLTYGLIEQLITLELGGIIVLCCGVLLYLWSFRLKAKWKTWMVKHSMNPKTSLELARASFLKSRFLEKLILWSPSERKAFDQTYEQRMESLRKDYLVSASEKYGDRHTVHVHHRFTSLMWMLLFELVVVTGIFFLIREQEDLTIKIIESTSFVLGIIGILYTVRLIWRRNATVLEISKKGIRIEDVYYGWSELEEIDVVRGNTLVYKKRREEEQSLVFKNLSLSAEYLDELILFYKTEDESRR